MENNIGPRMIHHIPMCSFVPQHLQGNLKKYYIVFMEISKKA